MPKYTQDDCRKIMDDLPRVRNVMVMGSMGHGKSVTMDNFGAKEGYLAPEKIGDVLYTLYRQDEKDKKANIKANLCHLATDATYSTRTGEGEGDKFKWKLSEQKKTEKMLFSLIDTPGHAEYSPEVAASNRMADGALVVVDVTSGVSVGLEYQLVDAAKERVKPVLFVSFLDKEILILEKDSEDIYQDLTKVVQNINVALAITEKLKLKGFTVDPFDGSVVFGSAYFGWAFSIDMFAETYAAKMKIEKEKMKERIWGDQFYNAAKKTWTKQEVDGSKRGFCQFIMDPIKQMHKAVMSGDEKYKTMCEKLGIQLKAADHALKDKALLKKVMSTWLPAGDALCSMMATHLPNPKEAARYRIEHIYSGEMDSDIAKAMVECDKEGPTMFCATKLQPTGSAGRFYAIGRCFSGQVGTDKYHVRAPEFDPEDPETAAYSQDARVQSIQLQLGKDVLPIQNCPVGNICLLGGVDAAINKTATITNKKQALNFNRLKFNVSAVLRVAIRPADPKQLPKLVEGLKRLTKSDLLVTTKSEPTGDHIVSGCGEEHLKTLLKDLKSEHAGIDFTQGVPTVPYKETVTADSFKQALSKSPNKHNRLYVIATPIEEECVVAIENGVIFPTQEAKKRGRILIDEFGWDKTDTQKIWGFGPADIDVGGANVIVDQTKGIQYLNEIKESVNSGLLWASRDGPLAEENMRGIRFNLMDVKLHADSIHRGMGQIQPTARRVFYGAALTAECRFMEPIYKVVVACPEDVVGGVRQACAACRGEIQFEEEIEGKCVVTAFIPIAETLGDNSFSRALQTKSSGKAFSQYYFDHWQLIQNNPLEKGSKAEKIMLDIRERKGMKVEQPDITDYIDRL